MGKTIATGQAKAARKCSKTQRKRAKGVGRRVSLLTTTWQGGLDLHLNLSETGPLNWRACVPATFPHRVKGKERRPEEYRTNLSDVYDWLLRSMDSGQFKTRHLSPSPSPSLPHASRLTFRNMNVSSFVITCRTSRHTTSLTTPTTTVTIM